MLFAGAYTFEEMPSFMTAPVEQYYGGFEHQKEKLPLGLLQAASDEKIASLPRLLLGIAERDPESPGPTPQRISSWLWKPEG